MSNPRTDKLRLSGIRHGFGQGAKRVQVLDDLSLTVREGEFVSILGPSGSGKSTIFHLIGGLLAPDAGQIALDGTPITGTKGHISYMPQHNSLFPWRTVLDNVLLPAELEGMPKAEARETAMGWLAKVGLERYADAYPYALSGGMQQRAAFVRALMSPRELLCMDEPFGALDALTRLDMQGWLLKLWEEHRRTVLFVTHSIEEALYLSDRIYVLSDKPARVVREIAVPFDRPREETVRGLPEFAALEQELYGVMKASLTSGR